ncbi:hypothetical protein KAR91_50580 [Candidatus Pacearchaeota archaeon]|nr:hypothetical protein [Candidatus Pacearchaeota archaeon]
MNFGVLNNAPEKKYIQLAAVVVKSFGNAIPRQWPGGGVSYETECRCVDGLGQMQTLVATSKFPDPVFDGNDIDRPMDWKMKWFNTKQGAKISGYPLKPKEQGGGQGYSQQSQQARGFSQQAPPQQQAPQQQQPNFNPSRPAQAPVQQAGEAPFTPPQQTYTVVEQPKPRDYDKENRGKCRFGFYQACLQAGLPPVGLIEDWALLNAIEKLVGYSMDGLPAHDEDGPIPPFITHSPVQYDPNNPPPADDTPL